MITTKNFYVCWYCWSYRKKYICECLFKTYSMSYNIKCRIQNTINWNFKPLTFFEWLDLPPIMYTTTIHFIFIELKGSIIINCRKRSIQCTKDPTKYRQLKRRLILRKKNKNKVTINKRIDESIQLEFKAIVNYNTK